MQEEYDSSRLALEKLASEYITEGLDKKRNEASTRLQLIDRLLFECLGWHQNDCTCEESHNQLFSDYTFYISKPKRSLIIEAKKEGIFIELPSGIQRNYSLRSIKKDYPLVFNAIEQTMRYCQERGVPIGAVCNGHQLICFLAVRTDGIAPNDGKAVIFDSFKAMLADFKDLWDYLSKYGISEKRLERYLTNDDYPVLPQKLSATVFPYPGYKDRNKLQSELQTLADLIIEDVSKHRDIEPEFIKECYCTSGALSQHALISKNILENRYAALFNGEGAHPNIEKATDKKGIKSEIIAASISSRPILLIGDVGVGKTMFIRNLISVGAADTLENAISIYIDFGSKAALDTDISSFILREIKWQLLKNYEIDLEDRNIVRGVYHSELMRFANGIYSDLRNSDINKFREKEIIFLEEKLQDTSNHLKACFQHISKGWKKQIVIFIDNIDQRSYELQENAFLMSQEIAAHWPCTIFLTIRPQTFFRSKKLGAISGYHVKAFTIAPPRVDEVLDKRLRFAKKIASGEYPLVDMPKNISFRLAKLQSYLDVLLWSFSINRDLIEFIDNISYGDIRQALEFVKIFISSGHVNTEKILAVEEQVRKSDGNLHYRIPLHEFLRAVTYGDYEYYDSEASSIFNLFDISRPDGKEHFLHIFLIKYIHRYSNISGPEGFVEINSIIEYIQNLGYTYQSLKYAIDQLLSKKLLESEARKLIDEKDELPNLLRTTPVGVYHVSKLLSNFTYIDAMIIDTPIIDPVYREKILDVENIDDRLSRANVFCQYLSQQWNLFKPKSDLLDWTCKASEIMAGINLISSKVGR